MQIFEQNGDSQPLISNSLKKILLWTSLTYEKSSSMSFFFVVDVKLIFLGAVV